MIRFRHTFGKGRRRGNAVMEAALVLPILLGLSFGTIEFGYFFFCKHTLQGAARDGARVAILPGSTNTSVTNAVNLTMNAAGFSNSPTVKYTTTITDAKTGVAITNVGAAATGTAIKVAVTAEWKKVGVRPIGNLFGDKWPLTDATMVVGFTIMVRE